MDAASKPPDEDIFIKAAAAVKDEMAFRSFIWDGVGRLLPSGGAEASAAAVILLSSCVWSGSLLLATGSSVGASLDLLLWRLENGFLTFLISPNHAVVLAPLAGAFLAAGGGGCDLLGDEVLER